MHFLKISKSIFLLLVALVIMIAALSIYRNEARKVVEGRIHSEMLSMSRFYVFNLIYFPEEESVKKDYEDFISRISHIFTDKYSPPIGYKNADGKTFTIEVTAKKNFNFKLWSLKKRYKIVVEKESLKVQKVE